MKNELIGMLIAAAALAVGCSHSQPKPEPAPVQPAPVQAQQAPAQPAPAPAPVQPPPTAAGGAPVHNGGGTASGAIMPKGAEISEQQATQTAIEFAQAHGLPGAYVSQASFKNGAWVIALHGPGSQPNTENKMSVVVANNGQVRSHALIPYGSPSWNKAK